MKNIAERLKHRFKKMPMRFKLLVSFSVPLVTVFMLLMAVSYRNITRHFEAQILYSADQSYAQAVSFLESHVRNMSYIAELIDYNGELRDILSSVDFNGARNLDEQYREFWKLDNVMLSIELSNSIYRGGVYVPDEIIYSANRYHFFPQSELVSRDDYGEFLQKEQSGLLFFTGSERDEAYGSRKDGLRQLVSLFKTIRKEGEGTPLGVARVSISSSELQEVLQKSDITQEGVVYLINNRGEILTSSNDENLALLEAYEELPGFGANTSWVPMELGNASYLMKQQTIDTADWTVTALVPEREFYRQSRMMGITVFAVSATMIVMIFLISYFLANYYTSRLTRLNLTMKAVEEGNVNVVFEGADEEADEVGDLFRRFNRMTSEVRTLMKDQYRLGKTVKSAELRALQAQINPHFLYNTLDLINWEAMDYDAPEIAEIAQSLAQFYRISLNKGRQIVTIEEELNHVKAYVRIERYHFDNAIDLSVAVPQELFAFTCINIILQPFVENSIMYGIAKNPDMEECHILIAAKRLGNDIEFMVQDDGPGMTPEQMTAILEENTYHATHGYGAKNINFRLKLCYGEGYGIRYESAVGEGTKVFIRIPAMTPEEAEENIR